MKLFILSSVLCSLLCSSDGFLSLPSFMQRSSPSHSSHSAPAERSAHSHSAPAERSAPVCRQVPKEVCKQVARTVQETVVSQECEDRPVEDCRQVKFDCLFTNCLCILSFNA